MAFIQWKLFVNFYELPFVVIDFLSESQGFLSRVDVLEVNRAPSGSSADFETVTAASREKGYPSAKFLFVLRPRAHR